MGFRLFVAGLPYQMADQELARVFAPCGQVTFSKVITDRVTGKSKGFGFVEMATEAGAKTAIQKLHKSMLAGRYLVVNEARPQEERPAADKPASFVERRSGFDRRKSAKPRFDEKPKFSDRPSFGDKPRYGEKPNFGKKRKFNDKPSFGRKPFGKGGGFKKGGYKGPKRDRY